jgi:hypothetical protein
VTEEIEQFEHYFNPGDRVVLTENGYKRMSYNDVLLRSTTYRVVAVINKNVFKIRLITR